VTPLRLLHVIPSFTTGGVPIRLVNIANRLGGDFRHLVLALDGVTSAAERLRPEVDHELVTLAIDKSTPVRNLWRFHSTLAALRPDLLLTYNWGAIDWAIVNSVWPVCRHLHFEDGFGPAEMNRTLRRRVLGRRYGLRGAERIIVPSHTLERIAREVWEIPDDRILYLANGVDCRRFGQVADPAIPGFSPRPGERIIGTVAPLRPLFAPATMNAAAHATPNTQRRAATSPNTRTFSSASACLNSGQIARARLVRSVRDRWISAAAVRIAIKSALKAASRAIRL